MFNNKKLSLGLVMLVVLVVGLLPQAALAKQKVEVSAGTIFYVETPTELNANDLDTGDSVNLIVFNDVKVDGEVIIEAGSPVHAVVAKAEGSGMVGKAGKLKIELRSVQAVDGTNLAIIGSKNITGENNTLKSAGLSYLLCPLFLLMEGEEAVIPAHIKIEARIGGSYAITVN